MAESPAFKARGFGTARRVAVGLTLGMSLGMGAAFGQCSEATQRPAKAQKLFEKSEDARGKLDVPERLALMRRALAESPDDEAMLLAAAEIAFKGTRSDEGMWETLAEFLDALEDLCPDGWAEAAYLRGADAYVHDRWPDAETWFRKYARFPEDQTRRSRRREVEELLPRLVFLQQFYAHVDAPQPQPLPGVNTAEDEYLPVLSPDGSMLFFTRASMHKAKGDFTSTRIEAFTWSQRANEAEAFDSGDPLPPPFNEGSNYGGAAISVDNKLLVLAARRPVPENPENIDLFATEYHVEYRETDGTPVYTWTDLDPLPDGINTPRGWEAQPALSGDGSTLFFAAARPESTPDPDGNLTMDIFASVRDDQGQWGPPTPLPPPVNSNAHDKSPFLHPDGRTLYFSSNREPSGGGFDLWMAQRDTNGVWSPPVNLGLPVNSSGDEHGLIVATNGRFGVFASRRDGTQGLDLCSYDLPEPLQPDAVTIVKGDVGWPLPEGDFQVSIEYIQSRKVEFFEVSSEDGRFAQVVKLPEGEDVVLTVQGDDIGYHSVVVHEDGTPPASSTEVVIDVDEKGSAEGVFELADIQFETRKSDLNSRSKVMLRALANHLDRHPALALHIEGHTDNVGDDAFNLGLSQNRAREVVAFLVSCGIDASRLHAEGYGETRPKASNATDEGRRLNRRTEFRWQNRP